MKDLLATVAVDRIKRAIQDECKKVEMAEAEGALGMAEEKWILLKEQLQKVCVDAISEIFAERRSHFTVWVNEVKYTDANPLDAIQMAYYRGEKPPFRVDRTIVDGKRDGYIKLPPPVRQGVHNNVEVVFFKSGGIQTRYVDIQLTYEDRDLVPDPIAQTAANLQYPDLVTTRGGNTTHWDRKKNTMSSLSFWVYMWPRASMSRHIVIPGHGSHCGDNWCVGTREPTK